jgi:drug/metabolite transporter (DMT)-like permease
LPRIGSRLTLLLAQCLAVPMAGVLEWWWLGTVLTSLQLVAVCTIVGGIAMALMPKHMPADNWPVFWAGVGFGVLAAVGQAVGAVLSRKAFLQMQAIDELPVAASIWEQIVLGATSGYQRLIGGALTLVAFFLLTLVYRRWYTRPRANRVGDAIGSKLAYVGLTAAAGPIFGIICYQWALATTPSAIVQPIVAMTPLVVMPLAYFIEGDRPRRRAIVGTLISVAGVLLLAFA